LPLRRRDWSASERNSRCPNGGRAAAGSPKRSHANYQGVAALVYVYDHEGRALAKRLTRAFHDHHDLSLATMHVHLDHESRLEVAVLRGAMNDIRHFAEHVTAERGVRHGKLVAVPVEVEAASHTHGGRGHRHSHTHVREAR
jgi:CopG family nickel-responsive transcriptional regulator